MSLFDNSNLKDIQKRFNQAINIRISMLQSNPELSPYLFNKPPKQETKMYYFETENGSTTSGDSAFIKALAQAESDRTKKEIKVYFLAEVIKPKQKPEWIPALVKYQDVPEWWRMKEQKSQLMGEVILVKPISSEETFKFEAEYGQSKANFWSKRNEKGGKWYWNKEDLILYPDAMKVATYASAKFAHKKGQKKDIK